jgi:hypothetical protein
MFPCRVAANHSEAVNLIGDAELPGVVLRDVKLGREWGADVDLDVASPDGRNDAVHEIPDLGF